MAQNQSTLALCPGDCNRIGKKIPPKRNRPAGDRCNSRSGCGSGGVRDSEQPRQGGPQVPDAHGLGQIAVRAGLGDLGLVLGHGVGGQGDDGNGLVALPGAPRPNGPDGVNPVHDRHLDVHEHQVEIRISQGVKGIGAVAHALHGVAHLFEQPLGGDLVDPVVLGQEDGEVPGGTGQGLRQGKGSVLGQRVLLEGQGKIDSGALARQAVEHHVPAHKLDQPPADGQPQARALVFPGVSLVHLGERREEEFQLILRDALAGVRDHEEHPLGPGGEGGQGKGLHGDGPVRSELERVAHQVDEHLLQPGRVADEPVDDPGIGVDVQDDALFPTREFEQFLHLPEAVPQVERNRLQGELARLDPGQVENVREQTVQPPGRLDGRTDVVRLLQVQAGGLEQLEHSENAVHGRADFVTHVRQEFGLDDAGGLGLLLFPAQLGLDPLALGDVPDNSQRQPLAHDVTPGEADFDVDEGPVLAPVPGLQDRVDLGEVAEILADGFLVQVGLVFPGIHPDGLFPGIPQHFTKTAVGLHDPVLGVDDQDAVVAALHEYFVPFHLPLDGLTPELAFRDVPVRAQHPDRVALAVPLADLAAVRDPDLVAVLVQHPDLALVDIRDAAEMPLQQALRLEQVLLVAQPLPEADIRRLQFLDGVSQHAGPLLVEEHFPGPDVPVPQPQPGGLHGQLEAVLALLQRGLGQGLVGHVVDDGMDDVHAPDGYPAAEDLHVAHGPVGEVMLEFEPELLLSADAVQQTGYLLPGQPVDVADPHLPKLVNGPSVEILRSLVRVQDLPRGRIDQHLDGPVVGKRLAERLLPFPDPFLQGHPVQPCGQELPHQGGGHGQQEQHREPDAAQDAGGDFPGQHQYQHQHQDVDDQAEDEEFRPGGLGQGAAAQVAPAHAYHGGHEDQPDAGPHAHPAHEQPESGRKHDRHGRGHRPHEQAADADENRACVDDDAGCRRPGRGHDEHADTPDAQADHELPGQGILQTPARQNVEQQSGAQKQGYVMAQGQKRLCFHIPGPGSLKAAARVPRVLVT